MLTTDAIKALIAAVPEEGRTPDQTEAIAHMAILLADPPVILTVGIDGQQHQVRGFNQADCIAELREIIARRGTQPQLMVESAPYTCYHLLQLRGRGWAIQVDFPDLPTEKRGAGSYDELLGQFCDAITVDGTHWAAS